jgi:FkbM family methyltransferase
MRVPRPLLPLANLARQFYYRLPPIAPGTLTPDDLTRCIARPDPVVLELGAHHGMNTMWFLDLFPEATIHCFEPDPRALSVFKSAINDPRVTLHEAAIAAEDGTTTFHMSDGAHPTVGAPAHGWDASGSIHPPANACAIYPWMRFERTTMVTTMRLDTWRSHYGVAHVDFIWADVQGAEADLIAGGAETLARTRWLYTEYSDAGDYAGQIGLRGILGRLPDFRIAKLYRKDMLLANQRFGIH